ncbi:MAG: NUDIX domain-containing protein [Janthinobacterium lividum]
MLDVIVWNILIKDDRIFLLKKLYEDDIEYTLVGGHVEVGESVKSTAIRETLEEVGVKLKEEDLEFVSILDRKRESGEHKIHFFFKSSNWQGNPYNKEADKHLSGDWFVMGELPTELCAIASMAVNALNNDQIYLEYP